MLNIIGQLEDILQSIKGRKTRVVEDYKQLVQFKFNSQEVAQLKNDLDREIIELDQKINQVETRIKSLKEKEAFKK